MRENEEAAQSVGSTQSGSGQTVFEGFDLPKDEFITKASEAQPGIEKFLMYGRDNALTVSDLQSITGWHSRQITKAVQDARRRGIPILSTAFPGGYFIAATEEEKAQCIKSLQHRENETRITRICLERAKVEVE